MMKKIIPFMMVWSILFPISLLHAEEAWDSDDSEQVTEMKSSPEKKGSASSDSHGDQTARPQDSVRRFMFGVGASASPLSIGNLYGIAPKLIPIGANLRFGHLVAQGAKVKQTFLTWGVDFSHTEFIEKETEKWSDHDGEYYDRTYKHSVSLELINLNLGFKLYYRDPMPGEVTFYNHFSTYLMIPIFRTYSSQSEDYYDDEPGDSHSESRKAFGWGCGIGFGMEYFLSAAFSIGAEAGFQGGLVYYWDQDDDHYDETDYLYDYFNGYTMITLNFFP